MALHSNYFHTTEIIVCRFSSNNESSIKSKLQKLPLKTMNMNTAEMIVEKHGSAGGSDGLI